MKQSPAPPSVAERSLVPHADGSGLMFNRIARRYDLLNRVMSFGADGRWRKRLIASLFAGEPPVEAELLDLATGTADVAIAALKRWPQLRVVGVDPSAEMLAVGQAKLARAGFADRAELVTGDAQALPFADGRFGASCIAFGIRNVPDRLMGLREMRRVTRPGGTVAVLELSHPRGGPLAPLARFYVDRLVPRLGAWLSGDREYRYLARSVAAFPAPAAFCALMEQAGLEAVETRRMNFGAVYLYRALVPPA